MTCLEANATLCRSHEHSSRLHVWMQARSFFFAGVSSPHGARRSLLLVCETKLPSSFNLFRMPDVWLPYFSCAMKVPGHIFGSTEEWVRPAVRVIPIGGSSAVTIMSEIVFSTKRGVV